MPAARPCGLCSRPRVGNGLFCARHNRQRTEYKGEGERVQYRRGHYRCGACGELEHNRQRCPNRTIVHRGTP